MNVNEIRASFESRVSRRRTLDGKSIVQFSKATRRVLDRAKKESHGSGYSNIGTEHLLAGLIRAERLHRFPLWRTRRRWISSVFRECGMDPDQILQKIRAGQLDRRPKPVRVTAALGFLSLSITTNLRLLLTVRM